MDVLERLTKQGKDLGYEGETLKTFVKEQQIELHVEREKLELMERIEAQKRDAAREAREAETVKCDAEAKIEHEKRKAEAKLSIKSVKLKSFLRVMN